MNYKKLNHVNKTLNAYDLAIKIKSRTGQMVMPVVETPLQYTVSLLLEAWTDEYWLPVAKANGFSLHAGVSCEGHERNKRERPGGVPTSGLRSGRPSAGGFHGPPGDIGAKAQGQDHGDAQSRYHDVLACAAQP